MLTGMLLLGATGSSVMEMQCSLFRARQLVLRQGDIDGFRATQMIQDKAQSAGNGMSFTRTATRYWVIWVAPVGRAVKRSPAVLRLMARTCHYRRCAPGGFLCPLGATALRLAEPINMTMLDH